MRFLCYPHPPSIALTTPPLPTAKKGSVSRLEVRDEGGGVQRAAAAGRGWRRTSGEKRGDGPPRKVRSFFCLWFLFFLQLNHIICVPTPLSPNVSRPSLSSPAVPSPSATGLGRCLLCRHGRRRPPDISSSAAGGELIFLLWFLIFSSAQSYYFYPDPPLRLLTSRQEGTDKGKTGGRKLRGCPGPGWGKGGGRQANMVGEFLFGFLSFLSSNKK